VSRLDSFLRRVLAQRACLDHAARLIEGTAGPVIELGLGNGRTFDHLRALFPTREVFAFDRRLAADPASAPDAAHLVLGDFRDTLPRALQRIGAPAALVHCDFGSGRPKRDQALAAWLASALPPLLAKGAVVVSDQALEHPSLAAAALPEGVERGRYFIYRAG
jgi:hypothetical protein